MRPFEFIFLLFAICYPATIRPAFELVMTPFAYAVALGRYALSGEATTKACATPLVPNDPRLTCPPGTTEPSGMGCPEGTVLTGGLLRVPIKSWCPGKDFKRACCVPLDRLPGLDLPPIN